MERAAHDVFGGGGGGEEESRWKMDCSWILIHRFLLCIFSTLSIWLHKVANKSKNVSLINSVFDSSIMDASREKLSKLHVDASFILILDGAIARNSAGYFIFSMASILPRCWSAQEKLRRNTFDHL
jgi:hypothetical protein